MPARKRPLLLRAALLLALLCLPALSGCPLVVLAILGAPIAAGGAITGMAVGSRTAYYNARDFYDAVSADQEKTAAQQITVEGLRLVEIYERLYRAFDRTLSPHALSAEDYVVLMQLSRDNGQRDEELSKNLGIAGFPLDQTIRNLLKRRLATRSRIERAATFVFLAATESGKASLEAARPALEHMRFDFLRRLSLEDRTDLMRLLAQAAGEPKSRAAGGPGGILGITTGGEAEFLLGKHVATAYWQTRDLLADHRLSAAEFQVISALWVAEEVGPRTLSGITQLRRHELDELVGRLSGKGYLRKIEKVTEEGPYAVELGPAGLQMRARLQPAVDAIGDLYYTRVAPKDRARLTEIVVRMSRGVVG